MLTKLCDPISGKSQWRREHCFIRRTVARTANVDVIG